MQIIEFYNVNGKKGAAYEGVVQWDLGNGYVQLVWHDQKKTVIQIADRYTEVRSRPMTEEEIEKCEYPGFTEWYAETLRKAQERADFEAEQARLAQKAQDPVEAEEASEEEVVEDVVDDTTDADE